MLRILSIAIVTCYYILLIKANNGTKSGQNCDFDLPECNSEQCNSYEAKRERCLFQGETASENTFPYIVSIQLGRGHSCGGSIVHPRWILTAKHCIKLPARYRSQMRIKPNYNNNNRIREKVYTVKQIFSVPGRMVINNDVALILLNDMIPFDGGKMHSVKLGLKDPRPRTELTLAGWGQTESGLPSNLMTAKMILRSATDCYFILFPHFRGEQMICAGRPIGNLFINSFELCVIMWLF